MRNNTKIQVDYTTKTKNFQLVFPINFEINIPAGDSVRLLSNVLEEIDYTELYGAYSRKEKICAVSPKNLFKILVYAYMNNLYSSRDIETACKRDINFMYLLEGAKAPDHNTIARFRSTKIPTERVRKYFPKSFSNSQIEDEIVKLCEVHYKRRQRQQER